MSRTRNTRPSTTAEGKEAAMTHGTDWEDAMLGYIDDCADAIRRTIRDADTDMAAQATTEGRTDA